MALLRAYKRWPVRLAEALNWTRMSHESSDAEAPPVAKGGKAVGV